MTIATLDQIYDAIINGKALTVLPEWVTDERMEREAATAAEHSRWTGEALGEAAGQGQSAGKGQSH